MKKGTKIVLGLLVAAVILGGALLLVLVFGLGMGGGGLPGQILLEADLETGIIEYLPADPVAQLLMEGTPQLRDIVEALEKGAADDRVVGFVAHVGAGGLGMAQVQEVRDAVIAFRASGKPAVAFSETFGEFAPGNSSYYLATAFDEIYLQPSGDVGLNGLIAESMFLRGAFEKLGVTPRMDHRKEYKNAMNSLTETSMTEAHEEAMQALVDSWSRQMLAGIAESRGMEVEQLAALVDRGPHLGPEALELGLVDGLAYRDEVYGQVRERVGENTELRYLSAYLKAAGRPHTSGTTVALIYGVGQVMRGQSTVDPLTGTVTLGSDSVAAAFREAIEDDDVEAILFRVDSPGGSYVASDTVWRETVRAREAGKPVIVSMGNLAGSGGYFVAMSADKIVAQPGTITGSIGVLGGKLLTRDTFNKLGLTFDSVTTADNAAFFSPNYDFNERGEERLQAWLDRVYEDFTQKVADGRGMAIEDVQEVAKGRIWTGEMALERGLVDAVGGYGTALALVREAAGLEADADLRLRTYPAPKTPFELFFGESKKSSEDYTAVAVRTLQAVQPAMRLARELGLVEPGPQQLMMPVEQRVQAR